MFTQAFSRLHNGIDALTAFLSANAAMRSLVGKYTDISEPNFLEMEIADMQRVAPSITQWRVLDHCATVSRLYALFEQFCEGILSDWIAFRTENIRYNDLPEKLKESYKEGFPIIFENLSKIKYSHLSPLNLVGEYNTALSGNLGYKLAAECFTYHKNNLRWGDIIAIFGRCGIADLEPWLAHHPGLSSHFQSNARISEQASSKLAGFVQYRNDASHGAVVVDEILGSDKLKDYLDFIRALCQSIDELLLKHAIEHLENHAQATRIGIVTEKFRDNVVICNIQGANIKLQDKIYFISTNTCRSSLVVDLMIDGTPTPVVTIANAREIGIKLDVNIQKRALIYTIS